MNDDIIIEGVGSFDRAFVQKMSRDEWTNYMKKVNPKFEHAEEVWMKANPTIKNSTPSKKKKEDVPDSNDQL